ncbi:MotA/TolQ/ExbB proton channel family protein [Arhodomonas sp. SL1]|uniref:MotA/TolQ/ExbB proton channel family protein n=1 Tax=Arhodomonas sp. SL1 TaxID=3425691 RepID=UPI003F880B94
MWELIRAGGWLMLPIIGCSVLALAIVVERLRALRRYRVLPRHLVAEVWSRLKADTLDQEAIRGLRQHSPLGRVLAAGLVNRHLSREAMMEAIEDTGRHEAHNLERYLNTLGTIAAVSPLLGLLGTVIGMIDVFGTISAEGVGNAPALAGGISQALITTASGLVVAIPALMAYRYLRGRVDELIVEMEQQALRLVEALHSQRPAGGGQHR